MMDVSGFVLGLALALSAPAPESPTLAMMRSIAPKTPWVHTYPETAAAIDAAAEEAPLFQGTEGVLQTKALEAAVAYAESTFRQDALGDKGRSHGLFQDQGYGLERGQDVKRDVPLAARQAVRLMRQSLRTCRALPLEERLAWYASGTCDNARGRALSRHRFWLAKKLLKSALPPPLAPTEP
jgi:hypothetical protein